MAKASYDQTFSYPTSSISAAAIHFAPILPREGSTTVRSPATIGIYYNFTTGAARITLKFMLENRDN